jgi:uncharacterized protein (TIGR02996 family)
MTDDDFMQALCKQADDEILRLVYADWLEERGDPRGAFLSGHASITSRFGAGRSANDDETEREELEVIFAWPLIQLAAKS